MLNVYAECCALHSLMLNVIMLSDVMLFVIMLNVDLLNIVAPFGRYTYMTLSSGQQAYFILNVSTKCQSAKCFSIKKPGAHSTLSRDFFHFSLRR
jgi:hypothetical protein